MRGFSKLVLLTSLVLFAGRATALTLEEMKLSKRFGIGIAAGGGVSFLGMEAEVNLSEEFSLTGALGTGQDYSTFAVKAKYFILGEDVSPYFALGLARWWTSSTKEREIGPAVLRNEFLAGADPRNGFSVWMMYPAVGVQFYHGLGFSLYAELQYLFRLFNFSNGTYAGVGFSWFF